MTTYTTEGMPKGYTLIRYGIFQWGWKCEDPETGCKHHSLSKKMTANGAQRYAWDHLRELSILSNQTNKMKTDTPKTDTPKTDAQEWDWNEDCAPAEDMIVPASFARELEREIARLRAALENIKTWADQAMSAVYDKRISAAFEQISDEADYILSNGKVSHD